MSDHNATAGRAQEVTIERREYDNPSCVVIDHHPVITTAVDGADGMMAAGGSGVFAGT